MRSAPFVGALIYAGLGALFTYYGYTDSIAAHQWTGASIVLGIGMMATIVGGAFGWFVGVFSRRLSASSSLAGARIVALLALAFAYYLGTRIIDSHRARVLRHHLSASK